MINFWQELIKYKNILIGIHVNPDGDCVGAALAIQRVLKKQYNIKSTIYTHDPIPECCKFLKYIHNISQKEKVDNYDLLLLLDVNSIERTKINITVPKIFMIDHHEKGNITYEKEVLNSNASSTCEIIFDIFQENNVIIDKTTAEYLLTGIICDTGGFVHSNTNSKVLFIASKLVEYGANTNIIIKKYFNEKNFDSVKIVGHVLNNLKSFEDNQIIIASLDNNFISKNKSIDSDSINNQLQSIKEKKITCFLRENEINKVRVSLRSPDIIDCNKIAMNFNGGGHKNAAGCTINGNIDEVTDKLISVIKKEL